MMKSLDPQAITWVDPQNGDNNQQICITDQAWGQDGWILAKSFFCIFIDGDKVEVNKYTKKKEVSIQPSSIIKQALSITWTRMQDSLHLACWWIQQYNMQV